MVDPSRSRDTGDGTGVEPDREPAAGVPRWVKVFGIVVAVVVLLLVVLVLARVHRGPSRHIGSAHHDRTSIVSLAGLRTPPIGGHG